MEFIFVFIEINFFFVDYDNSVDLTSHLHYGVVSDLLTFVMLIITRKAWNLMYLNLFNRLYNVNLRI